LYNNLSGITVTLQVLRRRLGTSPEFAQDVGTLDDALQAILDTIGGMGRLLQSERLRRGGVEPERRPVNLHGLLVNAARRFAKAAERKGMRIVVDSTPEVVAHSDRELMGLVVQNLVGNAVKFADRGTVRVTAACGDGRCVVAVSDEGPGSPRSTWAASSTPSRVARPTPGRASGWA
jgi:signal transduction histidine kinase